MTSGIYKPNGFKILFIWMVCWTTYPLYKIGIGYFYGCATGWFGKEVLKAAKAGYGLTLNLPHEQSPKDIFK